MKPVVELEMSPWWRGFVEQVGFEPAGAERVREMWMVGEWRLRINRTRGCEELRDSGESDLKRKKRLP